MNSAVVLGADIEQASMLLSIRPVTFILTR